MKRFSVILGLAATMAIGSFAGCSSGSAQSPDVSETIRKNLDQASLKEVGVSQDRDKGIITLSGHTASDAEKAEAETIARASAGGQVVADQIAVTPPGAESEVKAVNSDLDQAIEKNLDAALIEARLKKGIKYSVKNGVVTLEGETNSQTNRARAESIAAKVPNVLQVVNELQLKDIKATSSN